MFSLVLTAMAEKQLGCCMAITAACESCKTGLSIGEFCAKSPGFHGCDFPSVLCQAEKFKAQRRKKEFHLLGVFEPKCDDAGYAPKQCAEGSCWCVNVRGVQQKNTLTKAPETPLECTGLTKCQEQLAKACEKGKGMVGVNPPRCNDKGEFEPVQCAENFCWCVDADGVEVLGTAKRGELPECKAATAQVEPECCHGINASCEACRKGYTLGEFCAEFPTFHGCKLPSGKCQAQLFKAGRRKKEGLLGVFEPKCDGDEGYAPMQCFEGSCWCVDVRGVRQMDSMKKHEEGQPDCSSITPCQQKLREAYRGMTKGLLGVPMPQCDEKGEFKPTQCAENFCWCVDAEGNELEGTAKRGLSSCKAVQPKPASKANALLGAEATAPECCHAISASCEACRKKQTLGTFCTKYGRFHGCSVPSAKCQAEKAKAEWRREKLGMKGVFEPACTKSGYAPKQCREASCWCVDIWGVELKGTLKGPGEPQPTCDKLTKCQEKLAAAMDDEKKGLIGVYHPMCNDEGQFEAMQCAEGICWCVDKDSGEEVLGSAKRGQLPICNLAKPQTLKIVGSCLHDRLHRCIKAASSTNFDCASKCKHGEVIRRDCVAECYKTVPDCNGCISALMERIH